MFLDYILWLFIETILNALFIKFSCPGRIMVLHWIANPDPSGFAGSIPALGVDKNLEENF